jgi:hypothetical protein
MAKLKRGRLSGAWGMRKHTARELFAFAKYFEEEANNPNSKDDPRYCRRWAKKLRMLAEQKEKAVERRSVEAKKNVRYLDQFVEDHAKLLEFEIGF